MMYVCFFVSLLREKDTSPHVSLHQVSSAMVSSFPIFLLGPCASISLADAHQTAATQHFGEDAPCDKLIGSKDVQQQGGCRCKVLHELTDGAWNLWLR